MVERLAPYGVKVGAAVEVGVESPDGYREYKTRIEEIERDRLTLQMPTYRGALVQVSIGEIVQVMIASTQDQATMFLNSEVVARQRVPPGLWMLVVRVHEVGRQQSRGYFRVFVSSKALECSVWDASRGRQEAYWKPLNATIQDISGGGIGLVSQDPIEEGARVRVHFVLPYGGGLCRATGEVKVVRSLGNDSQRVEPPLGVGIEFQEIPRSSRERLIKAAHRFQAEEQRIKVDRQANTVGALG